MSSGFIYVLQNQAFGANVLKIGLTTRAPAVRAREIYGGSTGVPLPFDVAVAFSVADCERAEKLAHARLKTYRLNRRREFFRLPLDVGISVAHGACADVNRELNAEPPARLDFPQLGDHRRGIQTQDEPLDVGDGQPVIQLDPALLAPSPFKTIVLSEEHRNRIAVLFEVLKAINPVPFDEWREGFMRDEEPERELRIWEHMALAYLTLEHADDASEGYRDEAFTLLLQRTWRSTNEVLAEVSLKHFSMVNAKRLLGAYALRPKPLVVDRRRQTILRI